MILLLLAALAPAMILFYYVYHEDIHPEPTKLVLKGFLYGAIATFVSTLISGPLYSMGFYTENPSSILEAIKISFLGAAVPEELAKLFMLWLLLRHCSEFDERYDGIVYAAAVGLGFASFENIMYLISAGADWYSVSISRAIFAVPGHFAFAIVMGYYYSIHHFYGIMEPKGTVLKMILYPILLHGIYDSIVFISGLGELFSGLFTIVLIFFCFKLFKSTRNRIRIAAAQSEDDTPDEQ